MNKTTGDPGLDKEIEELTSKMKDRVSRELLFDLFNTGVKLAQNNTSRLDLKIASAALSEMQEAFKLFGPYIDTPKVTMFGSARTLISDPLYMLAKDSAKCLADKGWMVITGAGPGIMAAGLEGAGREMSMGVNIKLPFEQSANSFILNDPKLITMRYFFTRKLMMIKESAGFVVLPGGFGTLDECFELLTLIQTGKSEPSPVVLLDKKEDSYWHDWLEFVNKVSDKGYILEEDRELFKLSSSPTETADEILGFYRNYHSRRYVGSKMIIRLQNKPSEEELTELNKEFKDIITTGKIQSCGPTEAEKRDNDLLELSRIELSFDRVQHGKLRRLINRLNTLDSAPSGTPEPRNYQEATVLPIE